MRLDRTNISCGIYQLDLVSGSSASELIKFVKNTLLAKTVCNRHGYPRAHARPPVILFNHYTGKYGRDYGKELADHIEEKGYGKVIRTEYVNNRQGDFDNVLYTWFLDYKGLGIEKLLKDYK